MKTGCLLHKYFEFLDRKGKTFNIATGILCAIFLGVLDYLGGQSYHMDLFFFMPVSFVSWFAGRNYGIFITVICVIVGVFSNRISDVSLPAIWLTSNIIGFLVTTAFLFSRLRELLDNERTQCRTDHLTGAMNCRAFYETATAEILRLSRNHGPFSIAYIDVDNFKNINDQYGHAAGDLLLKTIACTLKKGLRKTDFVARVGGDEFSILLPDTGCEEAKVVIEKVRQTLQARMKKDDYGVTFSIGVVTCLTPPRNTDEIVKCADSLMYDIKRNGKNDVKYDAYVLDP